MFILLQMRNNLCDLIFSLITFSHPFIEVFTLFIKKKKKSSLTFEWQKNFKKGGFDFYFAKMNFILRAMIPTWYGIQLTAPNIEQEIVTRFLRSQ